MSAEQDDNDPDVIATLRAEGERHLLPADGRERTRCWGCHTGDECPAPHRRCPPAEGRKHTRRGMGAEDYCTCDKPWPCAEGREQASAPNRPDTINGVPVSTTATFWPKR